MKTLLVCFLLTLSYGFFNGFSFLELTTDLTPVGIERNYNGNEREHEMNGMKKLYFKKSEGEVLTIIHTHVLSLSMIFFVLGVLMMTTSVSGKLKCFLAIEPFISILLTFYGIWLIWKEVEWVRYVVMISGMLLVTSFVAINVILLWQVLFVKKQITS